MRDWESGLFSPLGPWTADAACRDSDPRLFDIPGPDVLPHTAVAALRAAVTICAGCPVRKPCEAAAITENMQGVWGGFLFAQNGGHRVDVVARLNDSEWWQSRILHRMSAYRTRLRDRKAGRLTREQEQARRKAEREGRDIA